MPGVEQLARAKSAPRRGDVPYSEWAERGLIGAILLDETEAWMERVEDIVRPAEFFTPEHRAVYACELALAYRGTPITWPTLAVELANQGVIDEVDRLTGGAEPYLVGLMGEWVLTAHGCGAWARIIHDYAVQRGFGSERAFRREMAL